MGFREKIKLIGTLKIGQNKLLYENFSKVNNV